MATEGQLGAASPAPPLNMGLRFNLSLMMFLEFAIWGSWWVVLGIYLDKGLHFPSDTIGDVYSTMPLGAMITPLIIGQIADRYFASELLMAVLHLIGAGALFALTKIGDANAFLGMCFVYALIFNPTLTLANSITFTHVPDGGRDFPGIRTLGTIGWIVANLLVGKALPGILRSFGIEVESAAETYYPMMLAALFSLVAGLQAFMLPHTPPKGQAGDSMPFLQAVGLLKEYSFAVFFGVSFVITIVLAFYYSFTPVFLGEVGTKDNLATSAISQIPGLKDLFLTDKGTLDVASTMTIGQVSEMVLLPFLPLFLRYLGMKWVLALGMLAWGVRYGIFAMGRPIDLVILSLALHGICFDFFFAAGFIHVDNKAPARIRASAQALFGFLTYGAGMFLGSILSGRVVRFNTVDQVKEWQNIWAVPAIGVVVSLVIFVVLFRDDGSQPTTEESNPIV